MGEYLSPGVFIEEIPARLKAIEGVSTSTAGLVGEAERGPVPGYLPFVPPAGFQLTADDAPILVTSFAEFRRAFGSPPDDPSLTGRPGYGYLSHAARAFFDNGGKRAFIARAMRPHATPAFFRIDTGAMLRLVRNVPASEKTIFVNSLRGIKAGATPSNITFMRP